MKRAGHLFEQVTSFEALRRAARRAARGKRPSTAASAFLFELETEVLRLQRDLTEGSYRPGPYRTFSIVDPKPRTISAAPFRDRVVHHALCAAMEPVLERYAIGDSYACRTGKGTLAALHRARYFARRHAWFLKLDVRRYFESADHWVLRELLRRLFKDRRLLELADLVISAGAPGSPPGKGLPIGNLTSQHFANLYLGPLDHRIKETLRIPAYCRYLDDLLLFADDQEQLVAARADVAAFCCTALKLELRHEATRLEPVMAGVPFLGFRIWPGLVRFDAFRKRRFCRKMRVLRRLGDAGDMDEEALARRAASLVSWATQADTMMLRRSLLASLGWLG